MDYQPRCDPSELPRIVSAGGRVEVRIPPAGLSGDLSPFRLRRTPDTLIRGALGGDSAPSSSHRRAFVESPVRRRSAPHVHGGGGSSLVGVSSTPTPRCRYADVTGSSSPRDPVAWPGEAPRIVLVSSLYLPLAQSWCRSLRRTFGRGVTIIRYWRCRKATKTCVAVSSVILLTYALLTR